MARASTSTAIEQPAVVGEQSSPAPAKKPWANDTRFKAGQPAPANAGRKKGQTSALSVVRDAILLVMEKKGFDGNGKDGVMGYLMMHAEDRPKEFLKFIGHIIARDQSVLVVDNRSIEIHTYETPAQVLAELRERGLDFERIGPIVDLPSREVKGP